MAGTHTNQHIVCQAYLNRFATPRGKQYIIGTRLQSSKQGVKLFTNSVETVAYIENYYDTCAQKDKKFWEHYLDKQFDALCGKPLENIVAKITLCPTGKEVLAEEDKALLSRIIMSQVFRVPAFLDDTVAKSERMLDSYKQEILQNLSPLFESQRDVIKQISFDVDERKDIVLSGVFDEKRFQRFCDVLQQKIWVVFYNSIRSVMPFITSDNPVVVADIKGGARKITSVGLESKKAVILYPLTPSILIGIYFADLFLGKTEKFERQRILTDDMKFITNVNLLIMRQSHLHSFLPEPLFSSVKASEKRE